MEQVKQREWHDQWTLFDDREEFLFLDWIHPATLEDFRGMDVLECGCGGGQHTRLVASQASSITAVDLNTIDIARERTRQFPNVTFVEADIATMELGRQFDIVFSIGVIHHTDDPDKTAANLTKHVKSGGRLIIWVYSKEGNALVRWGVEPIRRLLLRGASPKFLLWLSRFITAAMYLPIYTVYLLPLRFLPFYEYFRNFRMLDFNRNVLNVFDKLSAPQVEFIDEARIHRWFEQDNAFSAVHISRYCGVSWRGSGIKR
ncbi:MAG: class I SAM-dependent methyltransferase [Candidatus Hydrogenedentes bacterium]|nr:class I SAM-dependent methyltransferase [Candidatus Hydrogenedentota bacterium]